MSVRLRKNGSGNWVWTVDFTYKHPDGSKPRVREVSPLQTKRGAEQYQRDLLHAVQMGTYRARKEEPPKVVPTVETFSQDFLDTYAVTNNKPSEVDTKRALFRRHLLPTFGKLSLDKITIAEIEKFKAKMIKEEYSPKTVNNCLTALRKMLAVAQEWGLMEHLPKFKWLKTPDAEFDFLTFEEAERLVGGADGQFRPMMLLALRTGLRQGELLALRWDDVDLTAGRLVVRQNAVRGRIGTPKNGRTREIPLSPQAVRALKEHRHLKGELVFSQPDGRLLTKGECKHPLWRACRRAGLRRVGWHVLRHTFASHLVMTGEPLKAVQELMGHATIEMTMRYSHLSPDVKRDAVLKLDRQGTDTAPKASSLLTP
jgi:integrase